MGEESLDKESPKLVKIVLDVLKTHTPSLIEFSNVISRVRGVSKVEAILVEVDAETDSIKLVIEGDGIDYEELEKTIKRLGATIHSIDEVVVQRIKENQ
ncbi:MAG: DUF211 domain-containing protein [Nitrososphaerota archaeon]